MRSKFDSAKVRIAKANPAGLTGSVPVEDIYSYDSPSHLEWQSSIRTTFILTADVTLKYGYMVDNEE